MKSGTSDLSRHHVRVPGAGGLLAIADDGSHWQAGERGGDVAAVAPADPP